LTLYCGISSGGIYPARTLLAGRIGRFARREEGIIRVPSGNWFTQILETVVRPGVPMVELAGLSGVVVDVTGVAPTELAKPLAVVTDASGINVVGAVAPLPSVGLQRTGRPCSCKRSIPLTKVMTASSYRSLPEKASLWLLRACNGGLDELQKLKAGWLVWEP